MTFLGIEDNFHYVLTHGNYGMRVNRHISLVYVLTNDKNILICVELIMFVLTQTYKK